VYHKAQMWLARPKRSTICTAFVLALVVCVFLFAIYLKAPPPIHSQSHDGSPSQVKFWSSPNQTLEAKFKIAPIALILLFLAGLLVQNAQGWTERVLSFAAVPCYLRSRLPNRFRPPPQS